ncbi:hypothetical protein nbrc107696_00850 [Gordonia spumicola]|uniref:Ribonuclease VapC n=1 Tax=Gordonia spumicola TaxID=589161 RepID=A0A7I9V2J0_9ACTN|nr:PIN domain-containing protein [Gordonia spumicola]GED99638.1 hypothetical protein nbrc107696_00850 [Gordonia spumicola]
MSADPTSLVVVDTNVLVAATDRSRQSHDSSLAFLNTDTRRLAVTPQIVREYLAVATRPAEVNGFGLSPRRAVENVNQFLLEMEVLSEGTASTTLLAELVVTHGAGGKQIHDANVVAVALAHGADTVVTANIRHFARFSDLIEVEELR